MDIEVNNDLYPFLFKLIISKTRVKNVTRVINLLRLFPFNNSQGSKVPNPITIEISIRITPLRMQLNERRPTTSK